ASHHYRVWRGCTYVRSKAFTGRKRAGMFMMKHGKWQRIPHNQSGSTMLEALIAILIFSLGILSLVGLLGTSVKDTANSVYRTQASLLANEIVGQMWAGSQTIENPTDTSVQNYLATFEGSGAAAWRGKVANTLPGVVEAAEGAEGGGSNLPVIEVDGNNNVTVTLFWKSPGDSSAHKYVMTTRVLVNEGGAT